MTKSFFSSGLSTGERELSWPEVISNGLLCERSRKAQRECLSPIAQTSALPLRADSKTQNLPSGVQFPQHSAAGVFHPGSNGCSPVPSAASSQSERKLVFG